MSRAPTAILAGVLLATGVTSARAQVQTIQHSGWEFHYAGVVGIPTPPTQHGDPSLYALAPPIPPPGGDWAALTGSPTGVRNPDNINYLGPNDDYSSDLRSCLTQAEFVYFQSYVRIPPGTTLSNAKIEIGPLDDGARIVIFNSAYPNGVTPDGGYVLLGQTETQDLSSFLGIGEDNRIVIQYVDDCAAQGWLGTVELVVNGTTVVQNTGPAKSWGQLKSRFR